jgi:hypothetical protein
MEERDCRRAGSLSEVKVGRGFGLTPSRYQSGDCTHPQSAYRNYGLGEAIEAGPWTLYANGFREIEPTIQEA